MGPDEYIVRIRTVLSSAVRAANEIDSDVESLPEDLIPDWFAEVTRGSVVVGHDTSASLGVQEYVSRRGEAPWDLQDWLFCYDPQLRSWAWWDATQLPDESVLLWVDSSGEPVFPCEEFRWLTYVCGAKSVEGPVLRSVSEWRKQV